MTTYAEFLERRAQLANAGGFEATDMPGHLYPFQAALVEWSVRQGRAAIFADCGLGKTPMELAWAQNVHEHTGKPVLLLTPLAVSFQIAAEADKFHHEAVVSRDGSITTPIVITNYEQLAKFNPDDFGGVVCDESSILKNHTGPTRTKLIERWGTVPYRLACTATPAPNDHTELANHAEFLGAMRRADMLAAYFVHDSDTGWRLKGHAGPAMFRWMTTWAMAARRPSDITGNPVDDVPYVLPELRIHAEIVEYHDPPEGQLFATSLGAQSAGARRLPAHLQEARR